MDDDADLTQDAFLGGRVTAWQPRLGYRAGADAVLLASAVPARPGERVLELGAGVGVAALCLLARVPDAQVTGVEREGSMAYLARRNAQENGTDLSAIHADIVDLPPDMRGASFDHVMMNPPYFDTGSPAPVPERAAARHADMPMADWIRIGARRLKPKGGMTLIQKADRLPHVLEAMSDGFGEITVTPITGRVGRPAGRVIVQGRKGSKAPFRLNFPLVLHEGEAHDGDRDGHSAAARAILRDGAALSSLTKS